MTTTSSSSASGRGQDSAATSTSGGQGGALATGGGGAGGSGELGGAGGSATGTTGGAGGAQGGAGGSATGAGGAGGSATGAGGAGGSATGAGGAGGSATGAGGAGGAPGCRPGFEDCDWRADNGCEVNLDVDAENCGYCTSPCAGACRGGACVRATTHAGGLGGVSAIAVAGGNIFWADESLGGAVMQQDAASGAVVTLATDQGFFVNSIAADETFVFWVRPGTDGPSDGTLMKVPVGGGAAIEIAAAQPNAVAIDHTHVYWTSRDGGGGVMRASKDTDGMGPFTALAVGLGLPYSIAVDDTAVYWTVRDLGTVMSAPKDSTGTGPFTTLATGQINPRGIALDATRVHWAVSDSIMSVPKSGGAVTQLAAEHVRDIVADASGVYWTEAIYYGSVMKAWPDGTLSAAAAWQEHPFAIAVDATRVYWTMFLPYASGAVLSTSK
jgi:hypothetical protein